MSDQHNLVLLDINTTPCVLCRHKVIESVCTVVVYNTVRTAMIIFSFILLTLEIARKNWSNEALFYALGSISLSVTLSDHHCINLKDSLRNNYTSRTVYDIMRYHLDYRCHGAGCHGDL